jgi:hypothetical protein
VADDQTVAVLADVDQDKTLHFSAPTPLIDSFVPGDIVIFGVTGETPFGLLRRVTQVQREAGRIMVRTSPARLTDAIESGRIAVRTTLTEDDIVRSTAVPGVSVQAVPGARGIGRRYEVPLGDGVTARASIDLVITPDFVLDIRGRSLQYMNFEVQANNKINLAFEATASFSRALPEKRIFRYYFKKPIVVGPFVVIPTLTGWVGVEGSAQAAFTAGVSQQTVLTAGARYQNGNWTPLRDFRPNFESQEPTITLGSSVRGYLRAEVGFLIKGLAGPYAAVSPYLELNPNPAALE